MTIFTSKGQPIQIDPEDALRCQGVAWHLNYNGYATTTVTHATEKLFNAPAGTTIRMHRWLMGVTNPRVQVDHVNHCKADNRRRNLRVCSAMENMRNRNKAQDRKYTSSYKGVSYRHDRRNWRACIYVRGRKISLGSYDTELEAAQAYNEAAQAIFGEFAVVNDIPDDAATTSAA